jgi:hypothetical protein
VGAGHVGAGRRQAGVRAVFRDWAESGAPAHLGEEDFFSFSFSILFQDFQNAAALNQIWSKKMAFS